MIQYALPTNNSHADNALISEWVSHHSFGRPDNVWPDSAAFGVVKDGKPVGGIVYHDYKPSAGTVQYSGAATDSTWLMGPCLHLIFSYMFDGLGCQMVMTGNSQNNVGLHGILERLGHTKNVIHRGWGPNTDLYLWTLTKEQWLANKIFARSRKSAQEEANVKST